MYIRRKVNKEVKELLKKDVIYYKDIVAIHERYGY